MINRALFFDNSKESIDNIETHCNGLIQTVKIDESSAVATMVPFTDPEFDSYLARLAPNSYADVMRTYTDSDTFDPRSGIQACHLPILEEFLRDANSRSAVLFDFDRTLTMIEGYLLAPSISSWMSTRVSELQSQLFADFSKRIYYRDKIVRLKSLTPPTIQDMVLYLVGGAERLALLRHMFRLCFVKTVTIAILTNNSGCKGVLFDEILKELFQDIPYLKICSNSRKGKSQFLVYDDGMFNLCTLDLYSGGAKVRRTQKTARRRRTRKVYYQTK